MVSHVSFQVYGRSCQIHIIYNLHVASGFNKLLGSLGINVNSMISKGNALALSKLQLKYIAPLRVRFANAQHSIQNLGPLMLN
jgi:hypothetical protein